MDEADRPSVDDLFARIRAARSDAVGPVDTPTGEIPAAEVPAAEVPAVGATPGEAGADQAAADERRARRARRPRHRAPPRPGRGHRPVAGDAGAPAQAGPGRRAERGVRPAAPGDQGGGRRRGARHRGVPMPSATAPAARTPCGRPRSPGRRRPRPTPRHRVSWRVRSNVTGCSTRSSTRSPWRWPCRCGSASSRRSSVAEAIPTTPRACSATPTGSGRPSGSRSWPASWCSARTAGGPSPPRRSASRCAGSSTRPWSAARDEAVNAEAGPRPCGEAFPTGHRHPPAHAGCRCLLELTHG